MNFFERQEDARQTTRALLVAFALAVVAVVGVLDYFMVVSSSAWELGVLFESKVPWLMVALVGLVFAEEKWGRSVVTGVGLAVLASAILLMLPTVPIARGVSWGYWLWRGFEFAIAPQTLLIWAALCWVFITDPADLYRNSLQALLLLPAAMLIRLAIDLTLITALAAAQHPALLLHLAVVSGVLLAVILGAARRRRRELGAGGAGVAQQMGAAPLEVREGDAAATRLRNVVEEMAIAAGVPAPAIHVLDEPGINAMAAGWTPSDAAIVVTRGAVEQLTRDELQALVAHEISHILNGDMQLNIRLTGLMHGLTMISAVGRKLTQGMVKWKVPWPVGIPLAVFGAVVLSIGYLGTLFADLIRAAVSRQREYLADASAVQFTRHTAGLLGALKRIADHDQGSAVAATEAHGVSHMLFAEGAGNSLFRTHPPLALRMLALDARALDAPAAPRPASRPSAAAPAGGGAGAQPMRAPGAGTASPAARAQVTAPQTSTAAGAGAGAISAAILASRVGQLDGSAIEAAKVMHKVLPVALADLARMPKLAPTLTFSLFADRDAGVRQAQVQRIQADAGEPVARQVEKLAATIQGLPHDQRLALALIAARALRQRPVAELRKLRETVHALMHADGKVHVFEYALGAVLHAQLSALLEPPPAARLKLDAVPDDIALVLGVLAGVGHAGEVEAARAFQRGLARVLPRAPLQYAPRTDWARALDEALAKLDRLLPFGKKELMEALAETVLHDGTVSADEYELLRAVGLCLHCPLPVRVTPAAAA